MKTMRASSTRSSARRFPSRSIHGRRCRQSFAHAPGICTHLFVTVLFTLSFVGSGSSEPFQGIPGCAYVAPTEAGKRAHHLLRRIFA